jgi:hypothetical protein
VTADAVCPDVTRAARIECAVVERSLGAVGVDDCSMFDVDTTRTP